MRIDWKRRRRTAALAGALIMAAVATPASAAEFDATLTGDNQLAGGDPDGWGRAKIEVNDDTDRLCIDLEVRSIADVTAAYIHRGGEGLNGPPVIDIDNPDDEDADDCDGIGDTLADEIQANPGSFYVSVATTEFPRGAIRGQLVPDTE